MVEVGIVNRQCGPRFRRLVDAESEGRAHDASRIASAVRESNTSTESDAARSIAGRP